MTTPISSSSTSTSTTTSSTATVGATALTGNSVDGLVSGLDTTDIINKLMTLAAQPQTDLKNKLTANQAKETAYKAIQTDVDALQTAAQKVTTASSWAATAGTSSDTSVGVTTTGTAAVGSMTFRVTALAAGQADVSTEVASTTTSLATGPITITKADGSSFTVSPTDQTLAGVASALNAQASKTGVRATVVQTGPSAYRLQLASTTTGSTAAYTVSGLSLTNISQAQNATLTVGSGTNSYSVTSATNTVTGLMAGTTLSLSQVTPAGQSVTVNVTDDVTAHAAAVKAVVDAANTLLGDISTDTAYDASSKTAAVLNGNSTMRTLAQNILAGVSGGIGGGSLATLGISVTQDGTLSFDSTAFTAAYTADPTGTTAKLTGTGSFTAASGISSAVTVLTGKGSTSGLAVNVTRAATQSTGSFSLGTPLAAGQVFTVGTNAKQATITALAGWTASDLAAAISASGTGVGATVGSDGSVKVTSSGYGDTGLTLGETGSDGSTVEAPSVTAGVDVQGTVNGVAMTGQGQLLIAPYGTTGQVAGLSLRVSGSDTGALGTVSWTAGFAQLLANISKDAVDPLTGTITTDLNSFATQDKDLNTRISDWDTQLATQRTALQTQYANLETALGKLKDESSWLSSQISSLSTSS